jgi:magnesium transporter
MQSTLCLPVPSRNLLRFLRCQSKRAFASANHGRDTITTSAIRCHARPLNTVAIRKQPLELTTVCERRVTNLEPSLFDRDPVTRKLLHRSQPLTSQNYFSTSQNARGFWSGRKSSSSYMPTWNNLFKLTGKKNDKALKPDDLPNHDEFGDNSSIFNNRRTLAAKAASEPRLRCTEVDEHGNVILVDGEFKKTELIAKVWANIQTLRRTILTLLFF